MGQKVKLISQTAGVGELDGKGPQEIIAYAARVSNPGNQLNFSTASRLLAYCIKHGHWSVFETASFTVEITTTRAIAAQILRHRSFCFQEFSQRYAVSDSFIPGEARRQDAKNRQNSVDDLSQQDKEWFNSAQQDVWNISQGLYQEALKKGIAKECARSLLPLSTETTLYMTGNVRSFIHYVQLRSSDGTQLEHREIALGVKAIMMATMPDIAKALEWV